MNLPIDVVIARARVDIAKQYGIPLYKRIAFYLLGKRSVLNFLFSLGYYFNPCLFKKEKGWQKLRFKLPKIGDRVIMPLNSRSFLQTYKGVQQSKRNDSPKRRKVGIYIGCLSNYNYKNVGVSLLAILDRLGIDAMILERQECCGAPAFFSGDIGNTTRLIKKNLDYLVPFLDEIEALLIPEATCAAMLSHDWQNALHIESEVHGTDNSHYLNELAKLTNKAFMASKWIHDNTHIQELLDKSGKQDVAITYHDPCHARKVLGVFKEPRALLQNFKIQEMSDCQTCCGFGGVTIQSEKYHLAKAVGDKKAASIAQSGAQIVSAECSACRMQIDDSMARNNVSATFKHPLELIAQSLAES